MKRIDRCTWAFGLFYLFYFAAQAIYQGYSAKYYQSAGATTGQISMLLAAAPLSTIIALPLWGRFADRSRSRTGVLRLMIALAVVFMSLLPLFFHFAWMLMLSVLFPACYTAIQPMGDSIILKELTARGKNFGPLRMTGCVSHALINLFLGYAVGEKYIRIAALISAALALTFCTTFFMPPAPARQKGERITMARLFTIKGMPGLLALLMLLQLCLGYFNSFFSIHFTGLPGGTPELLGLAYCIASVSEIPFLLNSDRLFDRFGAGKLMLLSALTSALRFFAVALSRSAAVVLISQLLNGLNYAVMTVSMAKFVNAVVPAQLRSSGQMLITLLGFGLARTIGILGGGMAADHLGGTRQMLLLLGCVSALTFAVFAPCYLRRPPLNGKAP